MNAATQTPAGLGVTDWLIVAAYLLGVLAIGVFASRGQRTGEDFFLARRRLPSWAVAASILATSLSAVTFIGAPEDAFLGNLTYLSLGIGSLLGAIVVAVFFIPAFYARRVTTVYELLEDRFGSSTRRAASGVFMLGRVMASGARLYVAAIPVALIIFGDLTAVHLMQAIALTTVLAALYTSLGGIRAVVWTDVAQIVVLVGAAIVAGVTLLRLIPLDAGEIMRTLEASMAPGGGSKLAIFDWRLDPSLPYTMWSALIGFTLLNVAAYGADQDLAQRMLACKSPARASWSLIASNLMGVGVVTLFMGIGLLLYVFYMRPDVMGASAPAEMAGDSRRVFLRFILTQAPVGVRGLMMAGLFAAAMSSLDSALGAMGSTTVCDFYRPMRPGLSERRYLLVSRIAVVAWAAAVGAFACLCVWWQQRSGEGLLTFALGVMVYAYAGLLGVFLTVIFTKRGSGRSAMAAMLIGPLVVLAAHNARKLGLGADVSLGWRMLLATAASTVVCMMGGKGRNRSFSKNPYQNDERMVGGDGRDARPTKAGSDSDRESLERTA